MNGKHLPSALIEPQEALALSNYMKIEEIHRVKLLYVAYRATKAVDKDILWDFFKVLSFMYDTGRIQGIREERAKKRSCR